jgi:hypothetical protein
MVFSKMCRRCTSSFKKHFGTIEVPLGDLQKLVRGKKELPIGGIPDVIATMMDF